MPQWVNALFSKLSHFQHLDDHDHEALGKLLGERTAVAADTDLYQQGDPGKVAYILMQGWACRYKALGDGSRQIIDFLLTGDIAGLANMLSAEPLDDGVATLTPCTVVQWRPPQWENLLEEHPRLGRAILAVLADEQARLARRLVDLGRRSAEGRAARFLCEFGQRLERLDLLRGNQFACPITQVQMADALGFSVVHVNRTLRRLRSLGLIDTHKGGIEVLDFRALTAFATAEGDEISY